MTDLRRINTGNPAFEKEAIRLLKSIKKRWPSGQVDGKPVKVKNIYL